MWTTGVSLLTLLFLVCCTSVAFSSLLRRLSTTAPPPVVGCAGLEYTEKPCFLKDASILLGITTGKALYAASATECQAACASRSDCGYFTFERVRSAPTQAGGRCTFAPHVGFDNTMSVAVTYLNSSAFTELTATYEYVTGPAKCGQACADAVVSEIHKGCGASTPGVCSHLTKHLETRVVWDARCANSDDSACNVLGYQCCRQCDDCCDDTVSLAVLTGGTLLPVNTRYSGIRSHEHCHTMCVGTLGCTHFTYVRSKPLYDVVGGACYLYHYDTPSQVKLEWAPSDLEAFSSSIDCTQDMGMIAPEIPTETPATSCFESNVDYNGSDLAQSYGVLNATECQSVCQKEYGCQGFTFRGSDYYCFLKYAIGEKSQGAADERLESGPYYCGTKPTTDLSTTCLEAHVGYSGTDVGEKNVAFAKQCQLECQWHSASEGGMCNYWTWDSSTQKCFFKHAKGTGSHVETQVSGPRYCEAYRYMAKATRQQQVSENLPLVDAEEGVAKAAASVELQRRKLVIERRALQERNELRDESCYLYNASLSADSDLETVSNIASADKCQGACVERPDCKFFTFDAENGKCTFKFKGGSVQDGVKGKISGPRACDSVLPKNGQPTAWSSTKSTCGVENECKPQETLRSLEDEPEEGTKEVEKERFVEEKDEEKDEENEEEKGREVIEEENGEVKDEREKVERGVEGVGDGMEAGVTEANLGSMMTWTVSKSTRGVDMSKPTQWKQLAAVLHTNDCVFNSEYGSTECSEAVKDDFLPISLKLQAYAVAANTSFSGWLNFLSDGEEQQQVAHAPCAREVQLVNLAGLISKEGDNAGALVKKIAGRGAEYDASWPVNFVGPMNFVGGQVYARAEARSSKASESLKLMICIDGVETDVTPHSAELTFLPEQPRLLHGCANLTFANTTKRCFMTGAEIMPGVNLATGTSEEVLYAANAEDCQVLCLKRSDCFYFSFFKNTLFPEAIGGSCLLKPAPSLGNTLSVVVGVYKAENEEPKTDEYGNQIAKEELYEITSGPKVCGQGCTDLGISEIAAGCGASTYGTCSYLSRWRNETLFFDESCGSSTKDERCGVMGYTCCRTCDSRKEGDCCREEVAGVRLVKGSDVDDTAANRYQSVTSKEHCVALCRATVGCTHYTYLRNPQLEALEGGCYLKTYGTADTVQSEYAPVETEAVSGYKGKCGEAAAGEIQNPTTTTTVAPQDCFETNVDYEGFDLNVVYEVRSALDCQKKCQQYLACQAFTLSMRDTTCYLKFTTVGRKEGASSDLQLISGRKDCSVDAPSTASSCYLVGQKYGGTDLSSMNDVPFAINCQERCQSDSRCLYWTYDGRTKDCYLKAEPIDRGDHGDQISGPSRCPSGVSIRRLASDDRATWEQLVSRSSSDEPPQFSEPNNDLIILDDPHAWEVPDGFSEVDFKNGDSVTYSLEVRRRRSSDPMCKDSDYCYEDIINSGDKSLFDLHIEAALLAAGARTFSGFPVLAKRGTDAVSPCNAELLLWDETARGVSKSVFRSSRKHPDVWPSNLEGPINFAMGRVLLRTGLRFNSADLKTELDPLYGRLCFSSEATTFEELPHKQCSSAFKVPIY